MTADHGEAFYEHGYWEHTQTLYEEMVRIPLIVKWPKGSTVPAGRRIATQVSQTDVFPTLLEAAGVESPSVWALGLAYHFQAEKDVRPRTAVIEVSWDQLRMI